MGLTILLDTGPLGLVTHPRADAESNFAAMWLLGHLAKGDEVAIPEVCDYELRRKLHHIGSTKALRKLDDLEREVIYLPLTTPVMRRASELWARLRRSGTPTADEKELDCDVLLGALAADYSERTKRDFVVATTNVGHLSRMVSAAPWWKI